MIAIVADPVINVEAVSAVEEITQDEVDRRSRAKRRDLDILLNHYATYASKAYYETILDEATSIEWIFTRFALSL